MKSYYVVMILLDALLIGFGAGIGLILGVRLLCWVGGVAFADDARNLTVVLAVIVTLLLIGIVSVNGVEAAEAAEKDDEF